MLSGLRHCMRHDEICAFGSCQARAGAALSKEVFMCLFATEAGRLKSQLSAKSTRQS